VLYLLSYERRGIRVTPKPLHQTCTNGSVDEKEALQRYLCAQRDALLSKLDGVSEYDVRRQHVPTGTNLLGIVKRVAYVQLGYLGDVFGRPSGIPVLPWETSPNDPDADLWVPAGESREEILERSYRP